MFIQSTPWNCLKIMDEHFMVWLVLRVLDICIKSCMSLRKKTQKRLNYPCHTVFVSRPFLFTLSGRVRKVQNDSRNVTEMFLFSHVVSPLQNVLCLPISLFSRVTGSFRLSVRYFVFYYKTQKRSRVYSSEILSFQDYREILETSTSVDIIWFRRRLGSSSS